MPSTKRLSRPRGATLFEVIITTGLFSIMVVVLFVILRGGLRAWGNVESRHSAQRQLRRTELLLIEDLKSSALTTPPPPPAPATPTVPALRIMPNPNTGPLSASPGDAVWFLSARIPDTAAYTARREFARDPSTGLPIWHTNILYYLCLPTGHAPCTGFNSGGYDAACPHKYLIKKIIDWTNQAGAANEFDPTLAEPLLTNAQMTPFIDNPPAPFSLVGMTQPQVVPNSVQIIADSLLSFRVTTTAPSVQLVVRAVRVREAEHERQAATKIGVADLTNDEFTIEFFSKVIPGN